MTPNQLNNNKPTIAVLTNMISTPFSEGIIFGAIDYAKQNDYNVLCFAGAEFNKPALANMSRDRVFELVDQERVDGVMLPMGALSRFITVDEQLEFLSRFKNIPVITVCSDIPGYQNVGYSPRQGTFELVEHLVKVHNVTRFSFVAATGVHRASQIKKQLMIEAMAEHGLSFDERLLITSEMRRGAQIDGLDKIFTDDRQQWPEAIVASTDRQAQSVIAALTRRGIKVPEDVIVTGSAGHVDSLFAEPPITSIVEPTYELGWYAAERLIDAISGRPHTENLVLPTTLAIRRSCGCNKPGINQQKQNSETPRITPAKDRLTITQVQCELEKVLRMASTEQQASIPSAVPRKLAERLFEDLQQQSMSLISQFHQELEHTLKSEDFFMWGQMAQCIHRILMQQISSNLSDGFETTIAEALFKIVQSCNEMAGRYRSFEAEKYVGIMREIGIQLNSEFNLEEIGQLLAFNLNIPDCYISIFEESNQPFGKATCIMAMRDGNSVDISEQPYTATAFMPPEVPAYKDPYALLIMPLSFRNDFMGLCLLNMGERKGVVYEGLLTQFSSALKNQIHLRNLKAQEAHIRALAYSDQLTKLPNRSLLNERLNFTVQKALSNRNSFAVLFIDLDGFKWVNDSMGHDAGDLLLSTVANLFAECVREGDTLGRFGGDEFVVILPDIDSSSDAAAVAERIIRILSSPIDIRDQSVFITASVGISLYPQDGNSAETLLTNADKAMYRSKQNGKNRYGFYEAEREEALNRTVMIRNLLHSALQDESFELAFQPQVDRLTRQVCGVEALVRLGGENPHGVGPSEFIPLAEEIGLIDEIGQRVFRAACQQQRLWEDAGYPLKCSVNVSAKQFRNPNLANELIEIMEETAADPSKITIEVTENAVIDDEGSARNILQQLSDYGISIAIDDFGTGYASLSGLRKIPVDILKVDRSFVSDCDTNDENASIIAAIIMMAKGLKLRVIAEGVETAANLDFLSELGCDEIQGYLFARPLPAEKIPRLVDYLAESASARARQTSNRR